MEQVIKFRRTSDSYGFLSNFSRHPVISDNKEYPTSEHLYQAWKFTDPDKSEQIRLCSTPRAAADLGRSLTGMRSDWDEVKLDFMRTILETKVEQHPFISQKLIESGDAILVEDAPWDSFWGCGPDGKGQNWLGRLWMEIRDKLKRDTPFDI